MRLRKSVYSAALLAGLSPLAIAQDPAARPSDVPNPLRSIPIDSSIRTAVGRDLRLLAMMPPQVISGSRWRVLVAFNPIVPAFASDSGFAMALAACPFELPRNSDPLSLATENSPWIAFDSTAKERPLVVISVSRRGGPGAACGDTVVDQPAAVARGLDFVEPSYVAEQNPAGASLWLDRTPLQPAYVGRARVLSVRGGTLAQDTSHQLRLYIPLEDIRPNASGRFAAAELRITTSANGQDTVMIPESVLRQVWLQSLPWRIDRLRASNVTSRESASRAQMSLFARSPEARRDARVQIGTTLWAGGDTLAASVIMGQVLEADPCLAASADADPLVRSAAAPLRSTERCIPRSAVGVLMRGLTFPGLGQQATGRRGRAVTYVTAGVFVGSTLAGLRSRQIYGQYQSATTPQAASNYHDRASNFHTMATTLAVTGAALWATSAVEAAFTQFRQNRSIRAVGSYGGAR